MLQQHFQTERPNISPWNQYEGMLSDFFSFSVLYSINTITCHISTNSCRGVVVITSVLHTEGLQFDPGRQHLLCFFLKKKLLPESFFWDFFVPKFSPCDTLLNFSWVCKCSTLYRPSLQMQRTTSYCDIDR